MMSVLQFGMSRPLSMIVVQTSTRYLPATKSVIICSRPSAPIRPWPTPMLRPGSNSRSRAATWSSPGYELGHHLLEAVGPDRAVPDADAETGQQFTQSRRHVVDAHDAVVQVETLTAAPDLVLDRLDDEFFVVALDDGLDGQ